MSLRAALEVDLDRFTLQATFTAAAGVTVVLGPNGAGKSTLVRALTGTRPIDRGSLCSGTEVWDEPASGRFVAPAARQVGVVHQDLLLFPHLSARDNVAFGLRSRGTPRAEARRRAQDWLDRLEVAAVSAARPTQLSGGQSQRVALARALVGDPDLLLLDEPLSALDVTTRRQTRHLLGRVLRGREHPTILITHDPLDALLLADHVIVLEAGRITQQGDLAEVTRRPRTEHVAALLGTNLLRGTADGTRVTVGGGTIISATPSRGPVHVVLAPGALHLHRHHPEGSARNVWRMEVEHLEVLTDRINVYLRDPFPLVAHITPAAGEALALGPGAQVYVSVKATDLSTYPVA